jgi:hypothetical protein
MAKQRQLQHLYFRNTAFSYNSNDTPLNGPHYESGSANVLTSIKMYAERAPGFGKLESTATVLNGTIKRIFTWETWAGAFYVLVNYIGTYGPNPASVVAKMKIGTDSSFIDLYADTSYPTSVFDFCVSNNKVYFSNGVTKWVYEGSTTVTRPWGIGSYAMLGASGDLAKGRPTAATTGSGSLVAYFGWRYVYCYHNSSTNHTSSASNPSATTGAFSGKASVTVTLQKTTDAQVDKVRVFRTTDGGGGVYFEISGSPFAHTAGSGTMTVSDTTTDINLSSVRAPVGADLSNTTTPTPSGANDPPPTAKGCTVFANRIWMFNDNKLYFSAWEELGDTGLEEECYPPTNYMVFNQSITGIASNDEMLIVFTASRIWKITGDTLDTFRRDPLFQNMGTRNMACLARYGRSIAWFDVSHTVRITDGFQQQEVSQDIRPDIAAVNPATASLSFFSNGVYHWLCLLDGTGGKLYVYDLDSEQWMPPWTHVGAATALWWGETAAGTNDLLLGAASARVLRMTPSTYTFDTTATTYACNVKTNLFELVPPQQPSRISFPQVITVERNAIALSDLLELRDEDTDSGTYTSDFANIATVVDSLITTSPPLRLTGTSLVEEWFTTQKVACKRMSLKFSWAAASTNFKLYSFSIGYKEQT